MKTIFTLIAVLLISNAQAADTCFDLVNKNDTIVGTYCFSKDPTRLNVAEAVRVTGNYQNQNFDLVFTRLQNQSQNSCMRPKDRPPVCVRVENMVLQTPFPPLNSVGLPSIPSTILFYLPDLKGYAWDHRMIKH